MNITIDTSLCNGYGNCVVAAPEVFDLDPATNIAVLRSDATDVDEVALQDAVVDCPVRAIRLSEA